MEIELRVFLEFILPTTMASDSASVSPSSAGLFLNGEEGDLRGPEVNLKLTVPPSCLGVTALGYPPLLKEMLGVVAIIGVGGVQRRI